MSVENFIQAMPKVELHIHLEGAIQRSRLLVIAEQNEIAEELKRFDDWVALYDQPDYSRIHETIDVTTQWLQHGDDLIHVAYELGVTLAKQNVRYAEVSVNPISFTERGWTIEQFLSALNDGRNRAERGWGVQMRWKLTIARDQPRHADEIVRWASSAAGQNAGIVGIDLSGPEGAQPVGQFDRALRTAAKKQIPYTIHAAEELSAEDVLNVLQELEPSILAGGWGIGNIDEACQILIERNIPLDICLKRAVCHGQISSYSEYPLRILLDKGVPLILGSYLPSYYHTDLTEEYLAAVQQCGLSIDELEQLALNAVYASQLPADAKTAMAESFQQAYAELRGEHLSEEVPE